MRRNVLRLLATLLVMLGGLPTLGVTPAVAQEAFTIHVTIDQATIDPQPGEVTLTGTATCSGPEFFFIEIHGQLLQPPEYPHPHTVWAPFYVLVAPCPRPEAATFRVTFTAVQGTLRPGQAQLIAGSVGCVPIYPTSFCEGRVFEQLDTTIHLTPAR